MAGAYGATVYKLTPICHFTCRLPCRFLQPEHTATPPFTRESTSTQGASAISNAGDDCTY
ncbi:uncharacterized protein FOMMEDRAFT_20489 [Fomitiporia mediterranea MF3/22]|uniref:uncharacterized protein n=1 Tax=Fomitiporia mediterranea (strain MF3/22) TaxID=694068 RepID=UPI00044090C8|nr:uncharacterized protein FOMMEDRAFT_20489 [Fomitiporia mediterranea MF3/22]EJD03383.1 hypothetical protein FOMMEDRAFT_20489 [Fomitiporia mediterranea MF3/22]